MLPWSEEEAKHRFIQPFHEWNARNRKPKPFPASIERMKFRPTCVPLTLRAGDDRFAGKKKECVFVCDRCNEIVHFFSYTKGADP